MSSSSSASKKHPAWMDKLFPIVFLVGGVALMVFGSQQLRDGYASSNWPKTEGVITESRIVDKGSTGKNRSGGRATDPFIAYSYTVDREEFYSDRILFGMPSYRTIFKSGSRISREWLEEYPVGKKVMVAHKPSDPSQSTLETGVQVTAFVAPTIGVLFFLAGLSQVRPSKKREKSK